MTIQTTEAGSWRTTVAGVVSALVIAAPQILHLIDENPATVCDWSILIGAVIVGLGLGAARDNRVTSERAGAE